MRYYNPEIQSLSSLYDVLSVGVRNFQNIDFTECTKKQRKFIASNISTFYDENSSPLSDGTKAILFPSPNVSLDHIRETLKSASNKYTESIQARYREWCAFANRFDKKTEEALVRFIDDNLMNGMVITADEKADTISFYPDITESYRQIIYLKDPVCSKNFNAEIVESTDAEIDIHDSVYCLSFVQENEIVTIEFSDVCCETQLLNYSASYALNRSPWQQISDSMTALETKKNVLGIEYLNEKEKRLWRLDKFSPIHSIDSQNRSVSGDKLADQLFIDFARRAGNERIVEMTQRYSDASFKEKNKALKALLAEFKKPSSEALTKMILNEIAKATSEYPTQAELDIAHEVLIEKREIVTDIFKQKGYEGEYPHFCKMASLKGVKMLEIQGQPVTVINEKNMACMVDCFESCFNSDLLEVDFTASTVFLKKNELQIYESLDGYSGYFASKYRRRIRCITPVIDSLEDEAFTYDLNNTVLAAAKTAACEKLNKEDRKSVLSVGPGLYGFVYYVGLFLLIGCCFGLLFCPAMFLLALLFGVPITAFSSEAQSFSEYFNSLLFDFPWWQIFLFCSIGFGLPMTILTAIAKKRG